MVKTLFAAAILVFAVDANAVTILSEDFNSGVPPADWSIQDTEGFGVVWSNLSGCGEGANYTGGNGDAACVSSDLSGSAPFDTALISPYFSLDGFAAATLSFAANFQVYSGTEYLDVYVSTNGGASWDLLSSWNESHGAFRDTPGEAVDIDLAPYLGEAAVLLSWRYYNGNWDWYAQVDDVLVEGTVIPEPTTLLLLGAGLVGLAGYRRAGGSRAPRG